MTVEFAVDHLAGRARNGARATLVEQAELTVGLRGGQLDDTKCADQRRWHLLLADPEVLPRSFGLCAPVAIGRDLDGTERIRFSAGFA
jgi:hypothetical protein